MISHGPNMGLERSNESGNKSMKNSNFDEIFTEMDSLKFTSKVSVVLVWNVTRNTTVHHIICSENELPECTEV